MSHYCRLRSAHLFFLPGHNTYLFPRVVDTGSSNRIMIPPSPLLGCAEINSQDERSFQMFQI
ncbi:unnamed protein product [Notodromas monacha]|uniref:Uncharacterized protein n=1 Tax=Notodromas monacha TaxID=399045 RepID=A0A7R9C282_9CRUS|nr:unnamed protein product [Notodromas monacha]CAG0926058.1 unnamed protein product [Notodromas monacha]